MLDTSSYQSILPQSVFEKWCRALCESAVLLDASKGGVAYGRSYCPYPNCSELVLNECVGNYSSGKITESSCPSCKKLFCFHCMVPWKEKHQCSSSGEIVIDVDRKDDSLFVEIVKEKRWRRCPSCNHYVERRGGCNKIRCRCNTVFCHDCGSISDPCICGKEQQRLEAIRRERERIWRDRKRQRKRIFERIQAPTLLYEARVSIARFELDT
ncbi:E3 ubiquitin-protein ligase RNF144B-like [Papaver somniferum]|uniref:E3 ubiquitin-protein ligase RNF144B-like n=1 Tax=Papaver somniferum TaxID=3469 RepID=UPI000E703C0C|nr:E3 ubiquitin-protein ligase RNF144B-like [Papaver somniferum]